MLKPWRETLQTASRTSARRRLLSRIARSDRPIFVGPWRGEVGFEALYWLSYLDALRDQYQIAPERLIPITRSGAGDWYRTPTSVELCDLRSFQDIRVANRMTRRRTGMLKQRDPHDAWDAAVVRDAAERLGIRHYYTLHPSLMYHAYEGFWDGHMGIEGLRPQIQIRTITPPPLPEGVALPPGFLAVKFYARSTFAPSDLVTSYVTETVKLLAARQPVVLLETGLLADDHADFPLRSMPNVYRLRDLVPVTEANSLSVLSAVLGRSLGFVGTYGGIAQLALRMGIGSLSVYDQWYGTSWAHKTLSEQIALAQKTPWMVVRLMDLPLMQECCPRITVAPQVPAILSTKK